MIKKILFTVFISLITGSSMSQTIFKPNSNFCKPYGANWYWQCLGTVKTNVPVDKISYATDDFIKSLTVNNIVEYNRSCKLWPYNYTASISIAGITNSLTITNPSDTDIANETYNYSSVLDAFNENQYTFAVALDIGTAVDINCEMSVLFNLSTVEFAPLIQMVRYINSGVSDNLNIKEQLVGLKTLPSAWANLNITKDDIEYRIWDLEDMITLEEDPIIIMQLEEMILFLQELDADLNDAISIASVCSSNVDSALCLTKAKSLLTQIDSIIDNDQQKLLSYLNFVEAEIERVKNKNTEYLNKLNTILERLKRVLERF